MRFHRPLLMFIPLLLVGCGSDAAPSFPQPQPSAEPAPVTGGEQAFLGAGTGATSQFQFTLQGNSNAQLTAFVPQANTSIVAGFPARTSRNSLTVNLQNPPTPGQPRRFLQVVFGSLQGAALAPGVTLSANAASPPPNAVVTFGQVDTSPLRSLLFRSAGGNVTLTSLNANSAILRLDRVQMVPVPPPTSSTATGSFTLDGDVSVTF